MLLEIIGNGLSDLLEKMFFKIENDVPNDPAGVIVFKARANNHNHTVEVGVLKARDDDTNDPG